MSERNGDRARFQKDRKRKLRHRQRIQAFVKSGRSEPPTPSDQADKAIGRGSVKRVEGQVVTVERGQGAKRPRGENVRLA